MNFTTIEELILESEKRGISLGQLVKLWEAEKTEKNIWEIEEKMFKNWEVMVKSIEEGLTSPKKSKGGLIGGEGKKLLDYLENNQTLAGKDMNLAVARALAVLEVNASMGKIVAAPTGGSSGIIPSALLTVQEKLAKSDQEVVDALFTAAGIGIIIANRASISGAMGGCQAECGSAAGMAAAACVELAGGTARQAGDACAIALKNILGLVCDPVAGLVEVPCAKRNALGVSLGLTSADMALAGIKSVIPVDEVVLAMDSIGRAMPVCLKETAKGGLAITETGKQLAKDIFNKEL